MSKKISVTTLSVLAWAIGLYFLMLGIQELLAYDSDTARLARGINELFGGTSDVLTAIIAIAQIVCGALMILAPFRLLKPTATAVILLIVAIVWLAKSIYVLFIEGTPFKPSILVWLRDLSYYLLVLLAVWHTRALTK